MPGVEFKSYEEWLFVRRRAAQWREYEGQLIKLSKNEQDLVRGVLMQPCVDGRDSGFEQRLYADYKTRLARLRHARTPNEYEEEFKRSKPKPKKRMNPYEKLRALYVAIRAEKISKQLLEHLPLPPPATTPAAAAPSPAGAQTVRNEQVHEESMLKRETKDELAQAAASVCTPPLISSLDVTEDDVQPPTKRARGTQELQGEIVDFGF